MSVDSTEELKRQIEEAQCSEFDEWLKGFDEENKQEHEEPQKEQFESSAGSIAVGPSEGSDIDYEAARAYASAETADIGINQPWKFITNAELEERLRTLTNLDHHLEFQVKRRKDGHQKFEKKWDKTAKSQDLIVKALAKFTVLTNDCKQKRGIARQLEQETRDEINYYDEMIANQKKEIRNLYQLQHSLEKRAETFRPIREFLQDARDMSGGQLQTVVGVTNQAIILENIRLRLIVAEWEDEIDRRAALFQRFGLTYRELKNMLRLSNERTELCIKQVILEKEVRALEDNLECLKTTLRDGDVLASQLKLSVSNIYTQLCRRLSIAPTLPDSAPMKQLQSIGLLMGQLRKLRNDIYQRTNVGSDVIDLEVDTRATEKEKLRLKLGFK